ncbi:MAG: hypothetical protein ACRC1K_00035 [Planctomycetia bacterium]
MKTGFHEINSRRHKIEKLAAAYRVESAGLLPFPCFMVSVFEMVGGGFDACLNVVVHNTATDCHEYTGGLDDTIEGAVIMAIKHFMYEAELQSKNKVLEASDFHWDFHLHRE